MAKNVHISEIKKVTIPVIAQSEDRGALRCATPQKVLADIADTTRWKNDVTGIAVITDSLLIELERADGTRFNAPGIVAPLPFQSNAKAFVIDWRQVNDGTKLLGGCYKVVVNYDISGITGEYYYGAFRLLPYSFFNAKGTSRIFAVLNDVVRKDGINYKDSGFANSVRFQGSFGKMQPNYDMENLTDGYRVRSKVRNEALRSFELNTDMLTNCITERIEAGVLLKANQIYISEHNVSVHNQYFDFPVILDESKSPEFNYPTGSIYASVNAFFLEKVAIHESKYDGDISGSENITFELPQGLICSGGGYVNIKKQNGDLIASVLAPDDYNVANSPIDIGGNVFSLQATESLNVPIVDSNDVDVVNNLVGGKVVIPSLPCVSPVCDDGFANIKDTDDNVINLLTVPSGDNIPYNVADSEITIATHTFSVLATGSLNVPIVDTDGNTVSTTLVAGEVVVDDLPCSAGGVTRSTAALMKTGQTTSYATGDDGDLQKGRDTDFFTLKEVPVNNDSSATVNTTLNRFTDELGGQNYTNDIVIDWSTFDGVEVLGWSKHDYITLDTWSNFLASALAYSIGSFTSGWYLPNIMQLMSLPWFGSSQKMQYPSPYNNAFDIASNVFWSSTTDTNNISNALYLATNSSRQIIALAKTSTRRALYVRNFTSTGSTLI